MQRGLCCGGRAGRQLGALTAGGSPVGSPGAGAVGDGAVRQVAVAVVGRSTGDH